ncbi:YHS domain-containing protein [Herbaspirillum sp. HC18]|nr:YHS domain-containing protein [Herbaspirillum sp. HC18]
MQWLSENWIWIIAAIGVVLLMRGRGIGCGMGHGHGGHSRHDNAECRPENGEHIKDPVSGEDVDKATALVSAYQGSVYYFTTRANRDAFEAAPARYATPGSAHGETHRHHHHHHHHGC